MDYTRVSFDFRIAPNPDDIGSKPISNFFTRQELTDQPIQASTEVSASNQSLAGITYSNLCGGVSAKSQLMLCAAYCEANAIAIVGNESEIVSLDYMPVMQHYLSTASDAVNCVAVFSAGVFESDKVLADRILDMVKVRNNRLVFCAEGIVFDKDTDKKIILDLI